MTPRPAPSRPSFEEFMETHWKSLPKKSGFTTQQVEEIFTGLLKEMGVTWNSIKVGVRRAKVQAEVLFDHKKNLVLNYDDNYFNTLTEVEIRATLSHECCHVATLPDSTILAPSGDSPQAMFIEIYDEYLVHKEFARRFGGTLTFDAFRGIKNKDFQNYDRIVTMANAGMMNVTNALYTILNDAIYFPLTGDSAFADWCRAKNLPDLNQFLAWIIEDFGFIEGLKLTRMQTMELVPTEAALSAAVNYYHLLGDDRTYGPELFTSTANIMEEMVAKRTSTPLIDVWRKRLWAHRVQFRCPRQSDSQLRWNVAVKQSKTNRHEMIKATPLWLPSR